MTWSPQGQPDPSRSAQGPVDQPPWQPPPSPIPQYAPPQHSQQPYAPPQYSQPSQYGQPPYQPSQYAQPGRPAPEDTPPGGAPVPGGTRYADWGERTAAGIIDAAILSVSLIAVATLTGWSDTLSSLGGLAWFGLVGYLGWLNGSKGQSPGKALMGLRVVRDTDGSLLGGPVGLLRTVVLGLLGGVTAGFFVLVSFLWPLGDAKKRALHDKIVSASVLAGYPKVRVSKELFKP